MKKRQGIFPNSGHGSTSLITIPRNMVGFQMTSAFHPEVDLEFYICVSGTHRAEGLKLSWQRELFIPCDIVRCNFAFKHYVFCCIQH